MQHYGVLVDILNAPLVPGYGGQNVRDWDDADTVEISYDVPAAVQQQASSEDLTATDSTTTTWRLFCGPDAPLTATSRVRWAGVAGVLQVDGVPALLTRRGRPHHIEATLTQLVATGSDDDGDGRDDALDGTA